MVLFEHYQDVLSSPWLRGDHRIREYCNNRLTNGGEVWYDIVGVITVGHCLFSGFIGIFSGVFGIFLGFFGIKKETAKSVLI